MKVQKKFLPHLIALVVLLLINAIYFYPAYSGKILEQDDIKLGVAKSKELKDYREATGEEALWTNSMFSGMPTFQINMKYGNNIFEKLEPILKFFQPAQIGLILALMIGFYFLLISYGVNPGLSVIGAIAFGFSAFFIISFDAGHNAKIRAAGYVAPMLMGILLVFRGKRWLGLAFTALFAGLSISANHIQITYYATIIAVLITIVELIYAFKEGKLKGFLQSIGILVIAAILAIGPNISKLWTTYEYSKETIRGGGTSLKTEEGESTDGLDKGYAMSWSYGKVETLNLIIPNITGGGSSQNYEGTATHDQNFRAIKSNLQQKGYPAKLAEAQANRQIASLFYWGDQSMVNGAYYLGASIFFFFVLGLFLIRDKRRIWVIASVVLGIFMAWGKNLEWFNDILFEHLPLYNKFRVPSMTFFILFILMPFMGMLGLDFVIKNHETQKEFIKKSLLSSFYIVGGLFLLLAILGPAFFAFEGPSDEQYASNLQFLDTIIEDRKDLARSSAFRSLIFAGLSFGLVFLFLKKSIKTPVLIGALGVLILADLWSFDKQHLNKEDFVKASAYNQTFNASTADQAILKDKSYFRVFNLNNPFNDAYTSYYHKSIGGYHGAKLQRYQELYENVIFNEQNAIISNLQKQKGANIGAVFNNTPALNMLNCKYVIYNPQAAPIANPQANGNAWFIKNISQVSKAREVLNQLKVINTSNTAVVNTNYADYISTESYDGQGSIELTDHSPRKMTYKSSSSGEQFAVFSEIYYSGGDNDWKTYIDSEPAEHIRVNYVLRGMKVPAGEHTITFEFKPKAYFAGESISLVASIIFGLVFLGCLFLYYRSTKKKDEITS